MKINYLLLALPAFCLSACFSGDNATTTPDESEADASGYLAKSVSGLHTLSVDANYEEPCTILGEELVRSTFKLDLTTKLEEVDSPDGCTFEWDGNKVTVAFGGYKPYPSIYQAEYVFDKMFQGKSGHMSESAHRPPQSGPAPEGTGSEGVSGDDLGEGALAKDVSDSTATTKGEADSASREKPTAAHLTKPAVSTGKYVAVPNLGDKAVWDPAKGAIHVLYNNHIINVMVETKGQSAMREEHAKSLAEVLVDKVSEGEYKH